VIIKAENQRKWLINGEKRCSIPFQQAEGKHASSRDPWMLIEFLNTMSPQKNSIEI
jgi:hypothetical protein